LGDLARFTWRNVDLEKNEVRFITQKTGRHISKPMAPPLRAHVEELPAADDPGAPLHARAFEVMKSNGRVAPLSKAFAKLLISAGLREFKEKEENRIGRKRQRYPLNFHSLRSTVTTLLHEAGTPASVAQELIGHDSSVVHQGYVRVGREALEKAAAAFPILWARQKCGMRICHDRLIQSQTITTSKIEASSLETPLQQKLPIAVKPAEAKTPTRRSSLSNLSAWPRQY
jgi:integrase